jgi:biotin transport system substrate-specific component
VITRRDGGTTTTQDVVLVALFAAIVAALGLAPPIAVGVIPVPITLQTLGVMLAGAVLGPIRGALACALFDLLVAIGLPVLAGGAGGIGIYAGPSGGFVLGWIPGALVVGLLVKYLAARASGAVLQTVLYFVACLAGGIVIVYVVGIPWTAAVTGLGLVKVLIGSLVFIPGDIAKSVIAALVARNVRRAYPIALC